MLIVDETGWDTAVDLLVANVPAGCDTCFGGFDCLQLGNIHWFAGCRVPHFKQLCLKLQPEYFSTR